MTDRQTDRRTDRRTGKNNMSPDPEGGRHNNQSCKSWQYDVSKLTEAFFVDASIHVR